jgi:uncharacterized integral membrane protein (TIGR00697 family)
MSTNILRQTKAFGPLVLFHILIISLSNYLVQFPFEIAGIHNTWGAFAFPLIYLASDITVRLYGSKQAQKVIMLSMLPAFMISYGIGVAFKQGSFAGLETLYTFDSFAFRIALASFLAYCVGQWLDIFVFARMRQTKRWWVAPFWSNALGSLIDTLIFFGVAFYQSIDPFMAANWQQIALSDYAFKLLVGVAVFLPVYGVLINALLKALDRASATDATNKQIA